MLFFVTSFPSGFVATVAGMAGAVFCGIVLDRWRKYRLTNLIVVGSCTIFLVLFSLTVSFPSLVAGHLLGAYVCIAGTAFSYTSYCVGGFEVCNR